MRLGIIDTNITIITNIISWASCRPSLFLAFVTYWMMGLGMINTSIIIIITTTILIMGIRCISWVYCICKWVSDAENASDAGDAGDARAKASPPSKSILPLAQLSSSSSLYSLLMPTKISLSTSPKYHCVLWATPSLVFLCLADNIGCHVSRVEVGGEK